MKQVIISVHDVMPETLSSIQAILQKLQHFPNSDIYLLIVPYLKWTPEQLDLLRQFQEDGYQLAGHGMTHKAEKIEGLYHQIHSRIISQQVAEHLSLHEDGIAELISSCYDWFKQHDFEPPQLYVPPAWAMGSIKKQTLSSLPFRWYEFTSGIYDSDNDKFHYLPLAGFEADNWLQKQLIGLWNKTNQIICSPRYPLRISIHPNDFSLYLQDSLKVLIRRNDLNTCHLHSLSPVQ